MEELKELVMSWRQMAERYWGKATARPLHDPERRRFEGLASAYEHAADQLETRIRRTADPLAAALDQAAAVPPEGWVS